MKKHTFLPVFTLMAILPAVSLAQRADSASSHRPVVLSEDWRLFNHLDLGITAGVSGLGIDLEAPISEQFKVRAGLSYMPDVETRGKFEIIVGKKKEEPAWDAEGNRTDKLGRIIKMMSDFTGYQVDENADAELHASFYNAKLILDWYPTPQRDWHFSAGFYLGNRHIGYAQNYAEEMPSLLAVGMYNMMYDKAIVDDTSLLGFIDLTPNVFFPLKEKFKEFGKMGMNLGTYKYDCILPVDASQPQYVYDEDMEEDVFVGYLDARGELVPDNGHPAYDEDGNLIGYYKLNAIGDEMKAGSIYKMVPDVDGMVHAKAKVNRFKPYIGFGYARTVGKQQLMKVSFDCGVLFWGGVPNIIAHDGTDLTHDLNLRPKSNVKKYCDVIQYFPVLPMIELRVTRRLF